jgi:hypothetical protein
LCSSSNPPTPSTPGASGATFGVAAAATIDLLRRGVPWYQTFWTPTITTLLVLGFIFPAGVTWGGHVGGILGGGIVGAIACDPRKFADRRRLAVAVLVAGVIVATSLLTVPFAARHTTNHGPVLIGAPPLGSRYDPTSSRSQRRRAASTACQFVSIQSAIAASGTSRDRPISVSSYSVAVSMRPLSR